MCKIIDFLSEKRLSKYGDVTDVETAQKYFFNVGLCESFYPLLSQFEVALRNKIDLVFSRYMGPDWIFDFVRRDERLSEEQKITDRNELIDKLTFAFWSRLFMRDRAAEIWDKYPTALSEIFSKRKPFGLLDKVCFEVEQIRRYRNRISHNGSLLICFKKQLPCHKMHNLLLRLMRELGADCILDNVKQLDRFDDIFKRGLDLGFITCKI